MTRCSPTILRLRFQFMRRSDGVPRDRVERLDETQP